MVAAIIKTFNATASNTNTGTAATIISNGGMFTSVPNINRVWILPSVFQIFSLLSFLTVDTLFINNFRIDL